MAPLSACITVVFLVLSLSTCKSEVDFSQLSTDLAEAVLCRGVSALAVSILRDGRLLLASGFGQTDPRTGANVTADTRFGVASLSKAFAATLLVQLLYRNNMTLQTKVQSIMGPNFQFGDDLLTEEATVEDILTHRTGVSPHNNLRFLTINRTELVGKLRFLRPSQPFRARYMYNNLMYGLATTLAETLGRDRWENLVRREIFQPLGMTSSGFLTEVQDGWEGYAVPYSQVRGTMMPVSASFTRHWAELGGSGSVVSTARDIARWAHFHLSLGLTMSGQRVMNETLVRMLHRPHMMLPSPVAENYTRPYLPHTFAITSYGLAWQLGFYREFPIVSHTGSTYGFRSMLILLPAKNLSVFVTMVGDDDAYAFRYGLQALVLDRVLEEEPWLNTSAVCSFPKPWLVRPDRSSPREVNTTAYSLKAYEGEFENKAYGKLTVRMDDGKENTKPALILSYGIGQWRLRPTGNNSFYGIGEGNSIFYNVTGFVFKAQSKDSSKISGLEISGFESTNPPFFMKVVNGFSAGSPNPAASQHVTMSALCILYFWIAPSRFAG